MNRLLHAAIQRPVSNGIALGTAEALSVLHGRELRIQKEERVAYFRKAMHFALYFGGFSHSGKISEMMGAGKAAFLACSYDVATDWRKFHPRFYNVFRDQLSQYAAPELQAMALDLYEKDYEGSLAEDGLERGSIAFRFVTEMMNVRGTLEYSGVDIDETGKLLQIVDDVLDFEEDMKNGEMNCINKPKGHEYLQRLIQTYIETRFLFGTPLMLAVQFAREKAEKILSGELEGVQWASPVSMRRERPLEYIQSPP